VSAIKKQKLRNNEYYDTQMLFDTLYTESKNGKKFNNLLKFITQDENILLAYRNIKKNKGSSTRGTNKNTIIDIGKENPEKLIEYVRNRLQNFQPHSVKRIEIDKANGGKRPLGIPTIEDRLIQQCIKQILEPICEAKFYNHSYGFRPNRGTKHAIARATHLANRTYTFAVDIDIKGFFDNVSHGKLLKQIWALGIQDKSLICILSKMLKAEIKGAGIPEKGVPQGGILSPLLSNIVLNELDWWIASQWEFIPSKTNYSTIPIRRRRLELTSSIKPVFIVRYADDFKLFCKTRQDAEKLFIATKMWLKDRLQLEVSPEKSKIVNLKKQYSEFLGIKMKLYLNSNKWVVKSHIQDEAADRITAKIKKRIIAINKKHTPREVLEFNATILGVHQYFKVATRVYSDFKKIYYKTKRTLECRLKTKLSKSGIKAGAFQKYYGDYRSKIYFVKKMALFPIDWVKNDPPMCFQQYICSYTAMGRAKIHEKLKNVDPYTIERLMRNPIKGETLEYNDNRISRFIGQSGKCFVTGRLLDIYNMHLHHRLPRRLGGDDRYENLVLLTREIHILVHATEQPIIEKYLEMLKLDKLAFAKLNKLREIAQNYELQK